MKPARKREMVDHVRRHVADLTREEQDRLIETLNAPWDVRTRRAFHGILESEGEDPAGITRRIQQVVRERGMNPFQVPDALPVITEEEVQLVCWMVVRKSS